MNGYKAIPVAVASAIGSEFEKTLVVLTVFDAARNMLHFTTWGRDAQAKGLAAKLAEIFAAQIADLNQTQFFEDFEATPAAVAATMIEQLKRDRDAALAVCSGYVALCEDVFPNVEDMSPECKSLYDEAKALAPTPVVDPGYDPVALGM